MHDTTPLLSHNVDDFPAINRKKLEILQVNLGYLCNLSCTHCHVGAGPKRTELMDKAIIDQVLKLLSKANIPVLDLTGGAPEMNPHFRYLVTRASKLGAHVIDRSNLVILEVAGYETLAEFLAENSVEITASLPCYQQDNVDRQRGKGAFKASIAALAKLNRLGYGQEGSGLLLNLVYNPQGAALPPEQSGLEQAYKKDLFDRHGIVFNRLFAMANLPIQRFGSQLISKGIYHDYMQLLKSNFRHENLNSVMCLNTLSVDWQGFIYDCDFNQMLKLPLGAGGGARVHLNQLTGIFLDGADIVVGQHCFGCTAGQGSSCGGALLRTGEKQHSISYQ